MIKSHTELMQETDLLQGNINRMCVTEDEEELKNMKDWAHKRIDKIFDYTYQKIVAKHAIKDKKRFKVHIYSHFGQHIKTVYKETMRECINIWNQRCDEGFPKPTIWEYDDEQKNYIRVLGY